MTTSTSGMHLSSARAYPYFPKPLKKMYFSPTTPLVVLPTPEKHKFFGFTTLFDLNMKTHFKTTGRKRLRIQSRTDFRRYVVYYSRLSTLPSYKQQTSL